MVITSEIVLSQDIKMAANMAAMRQLSCVISEPLVIKRSDMAHFLRFDTYNTNLDGDNLGNCSESRYQDGRQYGCHEREILCNF